MSRIDIRRFARPGAASVNTFWIETDAGLIVVDGQRELSSARAARAEMDRTNKPVLAVFLTHPHPDHFGGLGVFAPEDSAIPLYGSAQTADSIRSDRFGLVGASRLAVGDDFPADVRVPTHVLADGRDVVVGDVRFVPGELGGGEAECATVLHVPEHGSLFAGDIVQHAMTAFLLEGRSKAWLAQLDALETRYPHDTTLYPGHGEPGPLRELVARQRAYLREFRDAIVAARRDGAAADVAARAAAVMRARYPTDLPVAKIDDLLDRDAAALEREIAAEAPGPART